MIKDSLKGGVMGGNEILRIAEYVNNGLAATSPRLEPAEGAIVFCRQDPAMAEAAATLFGQGLIRWAVLTGGIGKDSGDLTVPEAVHQRDLLVEMGVPAHLLHVEPKARHGGENSRFAIDVIRELGLAHGQLILVAHPDNARRILAVHTWIARREKQFAAEYQLVSANRVFDPENLKQADTALAELLRLADWPTKGWADPQSDLPLDLVKWARERTQT